MKVELHYFEGCPNWRTAESRLRGLQAFVDFDLELRPVGSDDEARRIGFRGSPTILVDGDDPFPATGAGALSCRVYSTPDGLAGVPTDEQLREVIGAGPA